MIHELKINPEYFKKAYAGFKRAELRKNDRDFKVGDFLLLKEFENNSYTGREVLVGTLDVCDVSEFAKDCLLLSICLLS